MLLVSARPQPLLKAAPAIPAGQDAIRELARRLDGLLADPRLAGAHTGVVVRHAVTGETLYSRNARARFIPASNQKLLVLAAAFALLGLDYRFKTTVLADSEPREGIVEGNLYLKGTGDPTFVPARYEELAASVAARGIHTVGGRLVADDSWFDDVRLGTDWSWDDETAPYAAQVSALTVSPDEDFDTGSVIVEVFPGPTGGALARVEVTPPTRHVAVDNQAVTSPAGSSDRVIIERVHGTNTIRVRGNLSVGAASIRRWISVWDPTAYAADVFLNALSARGIRVQGPATSGASPAGGTEIASIESVPLTVLAVPMMKLSNNGMAEILVKTLGRQVSGEGSWKAGLEAVASFLPRAGIDPKSVQLRDGSGLSRANLISPEDLVGLLLFAQREPWFTYWYTALPVAGVEERLVGGTLRSRMRGTAAEGNVRAKTGNLTSVSALSGYLTTLQGERLVFSILINNVVGPGIKDLEDALMITLAEGGRGVPSLPPPGAPQR
jgi:D-alanyl-D-alanine carboxypeptidase/D-alanyl-D-alanine-endopeptidase (penicillin-binding protein 4)